MTYLTNAWYVAALPDEIGVVPLARTLLDVPTVLFRTEVGRLVALRDRCPHRFVPLSRGKVQGETIACAYHGLRFDHAGACVVNPHGDTIPRGSAVRGFPVIERHGFVWIWPGDPARADPAALDLAMFGFLEQPERFTAVRGYLRVAAHYQLVHDNLLDLSHVEFLHPMLARSEGVAAHRAEMIQQGDVVRVNRWKPASSLNGFARLFWTSPSPIGDGRANITWAPPSMLHIDLGVTEVGASVEDGVCTPAAHLITPETAFTCHYFWAQARNRGLNDEALSQRVWSAVDAVFRTEDEPMIEAQQLAMGSVADVMALRPLLLEPDAPAVRARRILARLIAEEAQQAGAQQQAV